MPTALERSIPATTAVEPAATDTYNNDVAPQVTRMSDTIYKQEFVFLKMRDVSRDARTNANYYYHIFTLCEDEWGSEERTQDLNTQVKEK